MDPNDNRDAPPAGWLEDLARELKPQYPETRGDRGSAAFYKALALACLRRGLAPNKNMLYVAAGRRGSMSAAESGLAQAMSTVAKVLPSLDAQGIPEVFREEFSELLARMFARADELAGNGFKDDRARLEETARRAVAHADALEHRLTEAASFSSCARPKWKWLWGWRLRTHKRSPCSTNK